MRVTYKANPTSEQKSTSSSDEPPVFALFVASGGFGYWAFHGGGVWIWCIFIFFVLGFIAAISDKK
jgi:hypothetical protein